MDFAQDYLPLLSKLLPPSLLTQLITTLSTTFGIFKALSTSILSLRSLPTLHTDESGRVTLTSSNNPSGVTADFTTLILLAVGLFLSLKILNIVFNAVMFWVRLVFRILFWGAMVGVGLWVYYRGLEGFIEDLLALGRFWLGEYEGFKDDVRGYREQKERQLLREQREQAIRDQQQRKNRWW